MQVQCCSWRVSAPWLVQAPWCNRAGRVLLGKQRYLAWVLSYAAGRGLPCVSPVLLTVVTFPYIDGASQTQ